MVIGMGQHGKAGGGANKLLSADKTADTMVPMLLDDLSLWDAPCHSPALTVS